MKIKFENKFLKDLRYLDSVISLKLKNIILDIEKLDNTKDIKNIKKMVGYKFYYRIRIGEYRLGFKITDGNECIFQRIKHRKDIYKIFP